MKLTVKIDSTACITAANCVGVAPRFFRIGDEPYVELLGPTGENAGTRRTCEVTAEEFELLQEAADSCPTRAIELTEEG